MALLSVFRRCLFKVGMIDIINAKPPAYAGGTGMYAAFSPLKAGVRASDDNLGLQHLSI
jgi:hypothetical protein